MSQSEYQLGNFRVDECRPIKIIAIGAGYSGIIAAIRFRQKIKNVDFTVYDSNAGIGGTWFTNRYPGLTCDIPSHCYQLTFENNKYWTSFYAPQHEILQYLEGVVDKYKLQPYIKLRHRVIRARYDESSGKWHVTIQRPIPGREQELEEFEDTADVLFSGMGGLSRWTWPEIEGLQTFRGLLIHSADWKTGEGQENDPWQETVKSWGDKRVGVIGVGSSALQIVPSLQPRVKRLINYGRGKTWLSAAFLKERMMQLSDGQEVQNYRFREKDWKAFEDDNYYQEFRRALENDLNASHLVTLSGHPIQLQAQTEFKKDMLKRLSKKPWIADHIIPDFAVACRRLTPGPGYLEALCEDNCDFIPTGIRRVTSSGIETVDGKSEELDVIVCATGYDNTSRYGFPILGRKGIDLADKYTPYAKTYLTVAVDDFPNFFQVLGPNAAIGAGSLLLIMERQVDYIVKSILKLQRERYKSMEPKIEAIDDFDRYLESYFPKTVFGQKCHSWYKVNKSEEGRIVALWPGSPLHAVKTLEHPRWEDWNFERLDSDPPNRFYFLGDGHTAADVDPKEDRAWYLRPENIDYPPVPEDSKSESPTGKL